MEPLQLAHPNEYCTPAGVGATLTRPQLLASFSYDEERELLLERATKDAALRWYRQPMLGAHDHKTSVSSMLMLISQGSTCGTALIGALGDGKNWTKASMR